MTDFKHEFHPSSLREYDIRGIVDKTLKDEDLYAIGRAFGSMVASKNGTKVGLCYDGRHSSPRFSEQLIKGLMECGLQVENYGPAPTPLVYYALHARDLDAAICITGSHNPPEYNGIKMTTRQGPVYGEEIQEIGRVAASGNVVSAPGGSVQTVDISEQYLDRLVADYKPNGKPGLKIVWDAGNGIAGALLKRFTAKIPGEHILLFDDVDGDFPHHHPDPSVEKNLEDLKKAVIDNRCDVGIAFDGDADRIGAVDSNGKPFWGDQLVALYSREILDRNPGAPIIFDVKCSQTATNLIEQWGGSPILWKAGHSLIKVKMAETKAPLAGELSGHIFFKDGFYGHDDALYCGIRLLNVIQQYGPLASMHQFFPAVYTTPEIRFDVPEEDKFGFITKAATYVKQNAAADVEVLDIDGIRVTTPTGWWLLRASNTQNALTGRAEATSEDGLAKIVGMMKQVMDAIHCPYPNPLY